MAKTKDVHLSKRSDSGIYQAHVGGERISLGTRNRAEAIEKAREAKLPQLDALARSGAITEQAIAALTNQTTLTGIEALEQWRQLREANGRSMFTVAKDVGVVSQYLSQCGLGQVPLHKHDERHVNRFINAENQNVARTRLRQLSALRGFYEFGLYRGYNRANPAANVEVNYNLLSHEQKEPGEYPPFTQAQYDKLIASDHLEGSWFKWAVPIAYAAGLRLGDVASLERACVTTSGLAVWTEKSNGKRRVLLPFNEEITPGLRKTLASIPENGTPYFFPDEREIHLDTKRRSTHSTYFARILKRVGIEDRSFHGLRSTASRRWRALGFELDQCKDWLGHGSIVTTAGYTGDKVESRRRR